jgi:hypothetical protein
MTGSFGFDPLGDFEFGLKTHAGPVHHKAEEYLDAYLAALGNPAKGPLFRAMISHVAPRENAPTGLVARRFLAFIAKNWSLWALSRASGVGSVVP